MTNTVSEAMAWAARTPTHNGGTWNMWCAAAVFHAGGFAQPFPSAIAAYRDALSRGDIYSPAKVPVSKVPDGWLLFWDYGAYGHVGIQTPKGVLMASGYITSKAADNSRAIGYIDAARYAKVSGNRFLGSTPFWRGQHMEGISLKPGAAAPAKPATKAVDTLKENAKDLQKYAAKHGYDGPIDGKLGVNSWKGIQTGLKKDWDYDGAVDGKPGVQTYSALQRMAKAKGGYDGPIDGKMGKNSWIGVHKALT